MKKIFFLLFFFYVNLFSAYGEETVKPLSQSEITHKLQEFNVQIPSGSGIDGWTTDFIPFGAGGYIFTMHRSGNNIYVGGEFSSISNIRAFSIARYEISTGQWYQVGEGVRKPPASTLQQDLPGRVLDITSDPAGNIYIAGLFYIPNAGGANSIAKWDGSNWSPVGYGTGSNPGIVSCITIKNNTVYAGGEFYYVYDNSFTSIFVNRIAKFDLISNTWSAMGSGIEDSFEIIPVRDLTSDNQYVYAGGSFGLAGGVTVHQIARWNIASETWEDMDGGVYNGTAQEPGVKALEVLPTGILAVGGNFEQPALNIAFWSNATGWGAMGSAGIPNAIVKDIEYFNGSLLASVTHNFSYTSYVLKHNISGSWEPVSASSDGYIETVCATTTNTFFIGGSFSKITQVPELHPVGIAYYNGSSYEQVNGSITSNGSIFKRSPYPDGSFYVNNSSEPSYVYAVAAMDSNIYFGGQFETAGDLSVPANNIVGYNKYTRKWFTLGSGVDYFGGPPVMCLEADTINKVLYVGGYFRKQLNEFENAFFIGKYNTQTGEWSRMSGGVTTATNGIWALKYHYPTSSLYVSGSISINKESAYIAKWNGSSFSKAGTGMNTVAYSLEIIGNTLYAGGNFNIFSPAGQLSRIAQYDIRTGASGEWLPVGEGFTNSLTPGNASVLCLKKFGSVLYAAGGFTRSGSRFLSNIAFWNGTDWLPLGDGVWNFSDPYLLSVKTLDIADDGSVFVAGIFNNAGSISAKNAAVFRNNQWHALGQGLESQSGNFMGKLPMGSVISGEDWFVGGDFEQAGGNPSYKIARYSGVSNTAPIPPAVYINRTVNSPGFYNFNDSIGSTSLEVNLISSSGQGYIGVARYEAGPENVSFNRSTVPANISDYRFVVSQSGLSNIDSEVRFVISQIPDNGIIDISDVTVYKRTVPGQGNFDSVYTTYSGDTLIARVDSFSEFIFGSDTNPLPVELASFTSSVNANNVQLNWTTASEINNSGFEIERIIIVNNQPSAWSRIGFVNGSGTSSEFQNYSYSDNNLSSGKYSYRLKQIDYNGNYQYFNSSNEIEIGIPGKFRLSQNYPNPFNPVTKIDYDIPFDSKVNLRIHDITGREAATLINNEVQPAGYYTITFNASNLSSGVYFYRLTAGNFISTKKLVLLK